MKLLTASQIREWDSYTILNEPISSVALMNRAAQSVVDYILAHLNYQYVHIFCGSGNNGGDGLAIARMLNERQISCSVYLLQSDQTICSEDYNKQLKSIQETASVDIHFLEHFDFETVIHKEDAIIDALFGTGLNRPLEGLAQSCVEYLNSQQGYTISIDIPSGQPADFEVQTDHQKYTMVEADLTLTFQLPKCSMLTAEMGNYSGQLVVLDIGLLPEYLKSVDSDFYWSTKDDLQNIIGKRDRFSHKGSYGHGLLIAGGTGKGGAAIMSAEACLRMGVGKLTVLLPETFNMALMTRVPESMITTSVEDYKVYSAVAIGPGIDHSEENKKHLLQLIQNYKLPLIIDADGINLYAKLVDQFPKDLQARVVFTPHVKEFERLVNQEFSSGYHRIQAQKEYAIAHNCYILLKGAFSTLATPQGNIYFNSTGNPGMAKGGSGDVLTGMLLGLTCQGYTLENAIKCAVYIHGKSADLAVKKMHEMTLMPTDIIQYFSEALNELS